MNNNSEELFLKFLQQEMPWLFTRGRLNQAIPTQGKEYKKAWDAALLLNTAPNAQVSDTTKAQSIKRVL